MRYVGITITAIGFFGTGISMAIHIIGYLTGWWGTGGVTWAIPLIFLLLVPVGNFIDTYQGKKRFE